MTYWRDNIAVTLCKMEMFFPPSFFDSVEHLPIHLAEETLFGGPVHYRWMYPFERFIYRLKRMVTNKSKPEASMVNALVQLEISFLGSEYLGPEYKTKAAQPKRNEVIHKVTDGNVVSIFNHPGSRGKVIRVTALSEDDYRKAQIYIFSNTQELDDYVQLHKEIADSNSFSKWLNITNMDDLIEERYWMYEARDRRTGNITEAYMLGVRQFINVVKGKGLMYEGNVIRCPCRICMNNNMIPEEDVEDHLHNRGFVSGYFNWIFHGEAIVELGDIECPSPMQYDGSRIDVVDNYGQCHFQDMVHDVVGPRGHYKWNRYDS